ncbi:MAG TPA: hypothetical protein VGB63_07695 [Pedobacter sp.]|jgi:hypothetical protein
MSEIETLPASAIEQQQGVATAEKMGWTARQKFAFRVVFIYVIQLCIPLRPRFYNNLFNLNFDEFNWQTLSGFTGIGSPEYIDIGDDIWGLYSYINLGVGLAVALALALIWTLIDKKRKNYDLLYYWILVVARYRAAFGIIAWGMKKFVPKQMEIPSLTFLQTPFADFSEQKVYWQSVGIAQNYEIFLGFAEILAGVLLLFRKTTAIGAALLAIVLFNICIANHAYDGMVHVGSFTYTILGVIILWPYFGNVWRLLVKKEDVVPEFRYPEFTSGLQNYSRIGLKALSIGIFVFFSYYLHYIDYVGYRYPHDYPGLKNAAGIYEVTEFRLNNKLIPYSPLDSVRWQDAVFEKWSTLTFKVNRLQHMDNDNTGREGKKSINKRFEFRGIGGGRHYFNYKIDRKRQILYLENKNRAHRDQKQELHYERPSPNRIVLSGLNEFKDSIYVVLDRKTNEFAVTKTP